MRTAYCLMMGFVLFCCSCNEGKRNINAATKPVSSKLGKEGTDKIMDLLGHYYHLKDALVGSNAIDASIKSNELVNAAQNMILFLAPNSVAGPILQPYLDTLVMKAEIMARVQDQSCERQRLVFDGISTAMYNMLKSAGIENGGVYKQYCPMAFNDKGAYWLSEEETIKNPYFGKKMLECGEVQESF